MEGLLGDEGRGCKAPGAGLRECLPGGRPPCFLTWWSELNGLIVFQGTWIMLPDHKKLIAINAKLVPKGLCSLVDMAWKAHRGMGSHSTRSLRVLCVEKEEVGLSHLRIFTFVYAFSFSFSNRRKYTMKTLWRLLTWFCGDQLSGLRDVPFEVSWVCKLLNDKDRNFYLLNFPLSDYELGNVVFKPTFFLLSGTTVILTLPHLYSIFTGSQGLHPNSFVRKSQISYADKHLTELPYTTLQTGTVQF